MQVTLDDRTTTVAPEEAARRLGLEQSTLANWRWSGRGPVHIKVGGRVRYRLVDLLEYLEAHSRKSTCDPGLEAA